MKRKTLVATAAATFIALGLAACGGSDDPTTPTAPVAVGDTLALTASGRLFSFNRAAPGTLVGTVAISGLAAGEALVGIDTRPADGLLYALTSAGRIVTVDASTGVITPRATLVADAADTTAPYTALAGAERVSINFNPTVDRLRVVTRSGQNLRINVDTGATTTDDAITLAGGTAAVGAVAYTNAFNGANATQLFDLNLADSSLYLQNPPNNGVLTTPVPLGVTLGAGAATTAATTAGFDIDPARNVGHAALTVGGVTQLYTIDLSATANAATAAGAIALPEGAAGDAIVALALNSPAPVPTVLALTADNRLLAFNPRTPNTVTATTTVAVPAGESVVGIDVRPSDAMVYAVTRAADGTGRIYTVDAASGAATFVANVSVALAGTEFAVDFNPAANALRLISDSGQSLAVNLSTAPGTATVNGAVNFAGVPAARVAGAAYLNSGVSSTPPAATALYSLESATDVLTTQAVATGTLTAVGALGRDVTGAAGFDIAGSRNGLALAAFGAAGAYTLYEVNLGTGATALPRGLTADTALIGGASGPALRDLAIRF